MADASPQDDEAQATVAQVMRLYAVLAVVAMVSIVTVVSVATAGPDALAAFRPYLGASLLILFVVYCPVVLSARFATLMALGLCFSFVWSLGAVALGRVVLTPAPIFAVLAQHTVGAVFMALNLHGFTQNVARGMNLEAAAAGAATRHLPSWLVSCLAAEAALTALVPADASVMMTGIVAALSVGLVTFWVVPTLAMHVTFDEELSVRVNRAREWRERWFSPLAVLAVPRWAFAGLGIAALSVAILMFDAGRWREGEASMLALMWRLAGPALGLTFLVTAALGWLASRDWRGVVVCAAAPVLSASVGAWWAVHAGLAPPETVARLLVLGAGIGAAPCYALIGTIAGFRKFGDDYATAFLRALSETVAPFLLTGIGLLAAALVFTLRFADGAAACTIVVCIFTLPFALVPVLGSVMDDLFPKRRSLEEMYRVS